MFSVDPIPCMRFWALKKNELFNRKGCCPLVSPNKKKRKESKEVWCVNNFHSYLVIPTACSLLFNDFQYVHVVSYFFFVLLSRLTQAPECVLIRASISCQAWHITQHPPVHHPMETCYESVVDEL